MKENFVRTKLKKGEPSVGTWLTIPHPYVAQLMARTGFDWLTVELEHAPTSLETAAAIFSHVAAAGKVPLVRVPWNNLEIIKRVLDSGAYGIVVPMVNTRAEAEAVVSAARYMPIGKRSIGGQLHALNFDTDSATYYAEANNQILVIVMIEDAIAVENAEAIISTPGIDAIFIGPNDLHNSYGLKPAFDSPDPKFTAALEKVLTLGKKYGVPTGIHTADEEMAKRRIAQGFQFIAIASEARFLVAKAQEVTKSLGLTTTRETVKY